MQYTLADLLEAIASSWLTRTALIVFALALAITAAAAIAINVYRSIDQPIPMFLGAIDPGALGLVVGSTGTATAFLLTLFVAQHNYASSRENIPQLTLRLSITRTPSSADSDALILTLRATNTGRRLCHIDTIEWAASVISPYQQDDLGAKSKQFAQLTRSIDNPEFPWNMALYDVFGYNTSCEPGQTRQFVYDRDIPNTIGSIIGSAYVSNRDTTDSTPGWITKAVHVNNPRSS